MYVYLILSSFIGDITIPGGISLTVNSDLNGNSPQFTLTCISTGGPATTVTWTRDSMIITTGNGTVLDDPYAAQYTHTLTVTGRRPGIYMCTVAKNRPSSDSAIIIVEGNFCKDVNSSYLNLCTDATPPSGVTAVQAGLTGITVTWTASSDATGYRIYYTSDSDSGSETVSAWRWRHVRQHTLTGLVNGETYAISMISTSQHFPSEAVAAAAISLCKYCISPVLH